MEADGKISLDELVKRCACCFRTLDKLVVKEISKETERKFYELVQYEFISRNFSSLVCSECDEKLSTFESFKQQLQENQRNLESSLTTYNKFECKTEKLDDEEVYYKEDFYPEYDQPAIPQHFCDTSLASKDRKVQKNARQTCPICGKYFLIGSIDDHIKRRHSNVFNFFCDLCPKKFKVKRDLINHIIKHIDPEYRKKYQCEYCQKSYIQNSTLQHHIKMNHQDTQEEFQCECGAAFKTKLRLYYHKKITHSNGEFNCTICNKSYPSVHNLKLHISQFHASKSPCLVCGKLIAPGTFMKRHMKLHEPAAHQCDICQKVFTAKATLNEHKRTVHQLGETHYCETCGKSFGSKKVLKTHFRRTHVQTERLPCNVPGCSYGSKRKDKLIDHVKKHKDINDIYKAEIISKLKAKKTLP